MSKTTDSISSTCVLCCGSIKYYAVGQCNHPICLKCSTRMRVLCEQKHCSVCRADMPKVIATTKLHPFNGIISHKFPINRKAGIAFAIPKIQDEFRRLLWKICQICSLRNPEKTFKDLQDHMRRDHELFYCDLCIKHLKVFSFERKTYTRKDLALHRRKGDGKDTSYRGHPLCEFCDERYFDNDELLRHLRQQHYFCHFCETDGVSNQYYNDYDDLKEHFQIKHYLCEDERCSQEQFTHAFRSDIDLKAHRSTVHSSLMSKSQARQMRQIDMQINFPPRAIQRDGAPGFRGRGRHYHGNRDEDLSNAIHASLETSRQETSERSDGRRQGREERETKKTKQKKTAVTADQDDARGVADVLKTRKEEMKDERKESVTMKKESGIGEERKMRKKGGRTSPQLEEETQMKDGAKGTFSKSTESLENISVKQNQYVTLPERLEMVKETGKKKKKNKGKATSDGSAEENSKVIEKDSWQSGKPEVEQPVGTSLSMDMPNVARVSDADIAELNAKSAKLTWTTPVLKPEEDFPSLGQSSRPTVNASAAEGFSFYSALQKMDTKPRLERPRPMPAQRTFHNKEEDFPTLSSIAGILGVEPVPNKTNRTGKPNSQSAWTTSKEKSSQQQPAAPKQDNVLMQKKKGKKSAKENRQVVNDRLKQTQAVDTQKQKVPPQENKTVIPKRPPPGLPPGLAPKDPPAPAPSAITAAQPSMKTPSPVAPPPGFAANMSFSNNKLPPGFNMYVPPSDFQQRNLQLATRIKDYLGNQEEKFNMFRSISRQFRDGSMTATNYFMECRMLLKENLPKIFNELVSLLPDVVKQQELMTVESDFRVQEKRQKEDGVLQIGKGKGRGMGAWKSHASNETSACPQCGQVIHRSKLEEHLNTHQEFPTLAAGTRQPIHAAAPMWPRLK